MNTNEVDAFLDKVKLKNLSDAEKNDIIRKYWNEERQRDYNDALKHSKSHSRVPYKTRKKAKSKGTMHQVVTTVLAFSLAAGMTYEAYQEYKTYEEKLNIEHNLGQTVSQNISYGTYNTDRNEYNWWISDDAIDNIIKNIEIMHPEYDIDTKIYCCYKALPEYNKKEYMDKIVARVTPDESFGWYLNRKGLTVEEYVKLMEQILRSYAKTSLEENNRQDLFDELNPDFEGGSR